MAEDVVGWLEEAGRHPQGGLRLLDRAERETWFGWGEVRERAKAVAGGLAALGIRPGDRVALVFPTGIEFFEGLFGTILAGAVPVPLYPPVRLGRMGEYLERTTRMLERSGARLVLADARVRRILGQAVAAAKPELGCLTVGDLPRSAMEPVRVAPSDLALIQFSSGTTVDPKPVALSHRAVAAQVKILNGFWRDTEELRHSCVSWLPLYHDMGLIGCVFPAIARDATLTLIGPELFVARPALWLRALSRYRATISPAPNFAYSLCVTRVSDAEMDEMEGGHGPLRLADRAERRRVGGPLGAARLLRPFRPLGIPAGGVDPRLRPFRGRPGRHLLGPRPAVPDRALRPGGALSGRLGSRGRDGREIVSVGRPVPGFRLRIVDPLGNELPGGRVGRVWIEGPSLMDGYLGDPDATARALRDGWLDTGDLGFLDGGELFLTGRAKDVVILRGRNYAPDEIERAVDGLPGVRDGCVVAASWLPEDAPGETLAVFAETSRTATPPQIAALPGASREAVLGATGLAVDEVVLLKPGTLPRTSSGKLRRAETLRLHLAGELAPPEPVTPLRIAGAMARSSLAYAGMRLKRRKAG